MISELRLNQRKRKLGPGSRFTVHQSRFKIAPTSPTHRLFLAPSSPLSFASHRKFWALQFLSPARRDWTLRFGLFNPSRLQLFSAPIRVNRCSSVVWTSLTL